MKNKLYIVLLSTLFACTINGMDPESEGPLVEKELEGDADLIQFHDRVLFFIEELNCRTTRSGALRVDSKQIEQIFCEQAEKVKPNDDAAERLLAQYVCAYGYQEPFNEDDISRDNEFAKIIGAIRSKIKKDKTSKKPLNAIQIGFSPKNKKIVPYVSSLSDTKKILYDQHPDTKEEVISCIVSSKSGKVTVYYRPSLSEAAEILRRDHKSIKSAATARKRANIQALRTQPQQQHITWFDATLE